MPRAAFLRLKFQKLEEAERILRQEGIAFQKDPVAFRRESHYALLDESVLDERGRPLESFRRAAYDGAAGKLLDGEIDAGREILRQYIAKLRRRPIDRRVEELESLCFDGEMEIRTGDPSIGRIYLEAVAVFPKGNDRTDFAVEQAEQLLAEFGQ